MKKKIIIASLFILIVVFTSSCGAKNLSKGTIENINYEETAEASEYVKIEMNNDHIILLELDKDVAPITVENFQNLVKEKYYDGLIFHRVINNFMIQTGDPTGTGKGGSDKAIKGEFSLNGVTNTLSHSRGVISMARKGADPDTEETMNSASSQFFIVHKDSPFLDGKYAAFGRVIAGMDTVDKIATVQTDSSDKPVKEQKIRTIRFIKIIK